MNIRTGIGVDIHPLAAGRALVLGGVTIPHDKGLDGHSDGDALAHAVIDALLGAANLGDIGARFPSSDARYRGIRSVTLLSETARLLAARGWRARYVDATIIAERPVLRDFIGEMRSVMARSVGVDAESVSVKATTADRLGFVGRGEGICCMATATISKA